MKYGYAVVAMKGYGEIWWDEYYEEPTIKKVRLFDTEKECDNAVKIEKKNLRVRGYDSDVCKFITRG